MDWRLCTVIFLTILVIYLLSSYRKDCCVDSLRYGTMTQETMAYLRERLDRDLIDTLDELIDFLPTPSCNTSAYTMKELKYLQRVCNGATSAEKTLARKYDADALVGLREYAAEKSLDWAAVAANIESVHTIALLLKIHYNRPRPSQLGCALNMPVYALKSVSAHSPSYVSGHTLVAYYAARALSKKYPAHRDTLNRLADEVRLSREIGGWHYPSDCDGAIIVANYLAEKLK